MSMRQPHFVLYSRTKTSGSNPRWGFELRDNAGISQLNVEETEPNISGQRLELLSVVRGLEALPQPAKVTLVTASSYVSRGITDGLDDWRANDWQWEHHGEMVQIKNADLWQRIDRALNVHQVHIRRWRIDQAEQTPSPHASDFGNHAGQAPISTPPNGETTVRSRLFNSRPSLARKVQYFFLLLRHQLNPLLRAVRNVWPVAASNQLVSH